MAKAHYPQPAQVAPRCFRSGPLALMGYFRREKTSPAPEIEKRLILKLALFATWYTKCSAGSFSSAGGIWVTFYQIPSLSA